jgi:hypothetical protein
MLLAAQQLTVVQFFPKILTGFEIWYAFRRHIYGLTGSRVTASTSGAVFNGKSTKATELNPITFCKGIGNFFEYSVNYTFNIALIKVGIGIYQSCYQLRLYHPQTPICC